MDRYGNDVYDMTLAFMGVQLPTFLASPARIKVRLGWIGKASCLGGGRVNTPSFVFQTKSYCLNCIDRIAE